jgi:hypothetical protein
MKWKLPIPVRVRTLLVVIALGALTLGSAIGWVIHSKYDHQLELDLRMSRQIAWHLRQAKDCRAAEASGLPYPKQERQRLFADHITIFRHPSAPPPCDWPTEVKLHDEWAVAMQDRTGFFYQHEPASLLTFIYDFLF